MADAAQIAIDALYATLELNLPSTLASLDAERDPELLRLSDPPARFVKRRPFPSDADLLVPLVMLDNKRVEPGGDWKNGERLVTVRLDVWFPGRISDPDVVLEAVSAMCGAIYGVVETGDGRGPYMVGGVDAVTVCRPRTLNLPQMVRQTERQVPVQIARANPEFEIQVWI